MENIPLLAAIIIRALLPFTIFRWPLGGAFLGILGDIADVMIFEAFGSGMLPGDHYHNFDKFFDIYYLFFEFLVVFRWKDVLARRTAKALFIWRFIGFAVFELTGFRPAFTLAPNIFENFYIAWTIISKWKPSFLLNKKRLLVLLLIVGLPKIIQEYVMHYRYPDQTWFFLRDHLFWWLYN